MNIRNIKKFILIGVILFALTPFLLIGSSIEPPGLETITSEYKDLSSSAPISAYPQSDNIIFQSLPNPDLMNNTEFIENFYKYIRNESIIYDRPPSIIATYFIVSILDSIDSQLLSTYSMKIKEYMHNHYNTETEMFEENINYTYYNEHFNDGKKLLLAPYTPEITHEMALVVLEKCNGLSEYSGTQISRWNSKIWSNQNFDGGFGSLHAPNSTLLETYYAIEGLLALNDYDNSIFSAFQKNAIGSFIESRQRSSSEPFGVGAFGEYSADTFIGWEFFYASWLALNTLDMIGDDFSGVKDDFINFILDNSLNNPTTHCFYAQWNDRATPDIITYYGTAILGDCIRILGEENRFPDLADSQTTLISANPIEKTGADSEYNYFYHKSDVLADDLFSQYLIVNYLSKVGLWNMVDEQKYISYYESFLTENGAASYISNIWDCAKGDYLRFNSMKYSGIDESVIYDLVMS
ncbi:MAG: prenyltransferase/squalene oxidase repeat-containing protein, partial [Promethearchaeota archaeon]